MWHVLFKGTFWPFEGTGIQIVWLQNKLRGKAALCGRYSKGAILLYVFSVCNQILDFSDDCFVLNNYVSFATILRFFIAKCTSSFLSMTEAEMDADVCSQNLIRHAVPPQLCSSPSFSITMIRPLNWIPLRFYHFCVVLCFCNPPYPSTHAPPLTICASIFQLSLFVPTQLSTERLTFQ